MSILSPAVASPRTVYAARLDGPPDAGATGAARRVTRNVAWTLVSEAAGRGASLWLAFFCARTLPVAGFGLFAVGQSVAQYAWVLGDAVVNNGYATREIARAGSDRERLASRLYTLRLGAGGLLTAFFLVALALLPIAPALQAVLAAASLYGLSYASYPDWLARGLERFRALSLANLAVATATVGLSIGLLSWRAEPALAALAWSGSFLFGSLVLLPVLARGGGLRLSAASLREAWLPHVRRSSVFSMGAAAGMGITLLPIILLGALSSAREVGLFAAAFRLVTAVMGLGAVLWWPVYPALAVARRHSPEFRALFEPFLTLMLALSVPVGIGFALFARPIAAALFGADYAAAAPALTVLAVALPLQFVVTVLEIGLLATGGESVRARVSGLALAITVAGALLLMPRLGALGASLTFLLAIGALFAGYLAAMGTCVSARWLTTRGRSLALANLVLAAGWGMARDSAFPGPWIALALGGLLYAALLAALGIVRPGNTRPLAGCAESRPE